MHHMHYVFPRNLFALGAVVAAVDGGGIFISHQLNGSGYLHKLKLVIDGVHQSFTTPPRPTHLLSLEKKELFVKNCKELLWIKPSKCKVAC